MNAAINKKKFIAELSKLLTFMFDEDRQAVLELYSDAFDSTGDEEDLARQLVSPTRQAVVIARAYDSKKRKQQLESEDGGRSSDKPDFLCAAENVISGLNIVPRTEPEEAPAQEVSPLDSVDAFLYTMNEDDAALAESDFSETDEAVEEFVSELEAEGAVTTCKKTVVWALVLFILVAVPVTLALVMLMVLLAALFLGLAAGSGALGVIAVGAAFGGGFAMISDILVVAGVAVLLLALGLLFLWTAVWFLVGALPGIIRGIIGLGRRLCVKEVAE